MRLGRRRPERQAAEAYVDNMQQIYETSPMSLASVVGMSQNTAPYRSDYF